MESSTLCKDAKQEHKGKCSNPSLPNPTKATNAIEELERKNKGGGQPMTPRSRSNGFPPLRGGIDCWSCRSRSSLPNPSKICKKHWREERGSKLMRFNNGGERKAQELLPT
jgi:hypothetical protein